jgi:hypothetical protein
MTCETDPKIINMLQVAGAAFSYQSRLLGTWLNPGMNGIAGATAKMIFRPDGTGSVFDTVNQTTPMDEFTYEFKKKNDETGIYHMVSKYEPNNRWYSLIQIVDNSGMQMMYWGAFGQNIEQFPQKWSENPPFVWQGVLSAE